MKIKELAERLQITVERVEGLTKAIEEAQADSLDRFSERENIYQMHYFLICSGLVEDNYKDWRVFRVIFRLIEDGKNE